VRYDDHTRVTYPVGDREAARARGGPAQARFLTAALAPNEGNQKRVMRIVPSSQTGPHTHAPQHPHPVCEPRRFPLGGAFALGHCRSRLTRWNRSHARRRRVLGLQPGLARTGPVWVLAVLRYDAFGPETAGVGEGRRAIASKCSLNWTPGGACRAHSLTGALRSSSGRWRQSSPFTSSTSKA
jgi:hypothetical protein